MIDNNLIFAADSTRMSAGGESLLSRIGDGILYGAPAAAVSGLQSIANTAIWYANKLFNADIEQLDTARTLSNFSDNLGAYYEANKDPIDTVGFIGGAFIPGLAAVKGLNLFRAGNSAGMFRSVLGFSQKKQTEYLGKALGQLASEGPSVFSAINGNKLASMAYGAVDNVIQTAAFETAVALTMHQSTTLKDENPQQVFYDIVKTSLLGGAIGGGIEALFVNKIMRDATKTVNAGLRKIDSVAALEKMGLTFGDKTFSLMDSLLDLPMKIGDDSIKLPFSYKLNGKTGPTSELDITQLAEGKLSETWRRGLQEFQAKINYVNPNDLTVGSSFGKALMEIYAEGRKDNRTPNEIKNLLLNHLGNLTRVDGLAADLSNANLNDATYFFMKNVDVSSPGDLLTSITTTKPAAGAANAYRLVGDNWGQLKLGILGIDAPATKAEAFRAGFDVVIDAGSKKFEVNKASKLLLPVTDPTSEDVVKMIFNPRTKTTSQVAVPTIADLQTPGKVLIPTATGVSAGGRTYAFTAGNFDPAADSIKSSARHIWGSQVKSLHGQKIDIRDVSLVDAILENPTLMDEQTKIVGHTGELLDIPYYAQREALASMALEQKLESIKALYSSEAKAFEIDTRAVAIRFNTEPQFIEKAVAADFNLQRLEAQAKAEAFRPLKSYLERENLVLSYDKKAMENAEKFLDGTLWYQHRVYEAEQNALSAASAVLGKHAIGLPNWTQVTAGQKIANQADTAGTGPGFVSSSNANYDDPLKATMQASGTIATLAKQEATNIALETIQPHAATIIGSNSPELGAVLTRARRSGNKLRFLDDENRIVDKGYYEKWEQGILKDGEVPTVDIPMSDETANFLRSYHSGHQTWLEKKRTLAAAAGTPIHWDPADLYFPPIDTKRFPYFALVKETEGKAFGLGEVSMVSARSEKELAELTARIKQDHPTLDVIFKEDTKAYHKAKADYDYGSGMNAPYLDPYLRREGVAGDFLPTLEPKAVIEDFVNHISRREEGLVNAAIQTYYARPFAELDWLSQEYTKISTSKFQFLGKQFGKTIEDPFGDYKRLALGISKRAEYTLWHEATAFVDSLGQGAYRVAESSWKDAKGSKISWEEANAAMERVGIQGPFKSQEAFLTAQIGGDRNLIKEAVYKGNMLLANVGLRLDFANTLVNLIASPLMYGAEMSSITNSLKKDPELFQKFSAALRVGEPTTGLQVPTPMRVLSQSFSDYWGPAKEELFERFKTLGIIKNVNSQYHAMLGDISLTPNMVPNAWAKKIGEWTEKGATLTGNNWAEDFTRFIAGNSMRRMTQPLVDAGNMTIKEQNAMMMIFVNRVQGNYIASQRPIMFQGTVGAAISLFQTYQFNLFQQLFRHIENRDMKTIATLGGMQSFLFGLNGLPLFDAVNTHIIGNASINEGHKDVYSQLTKAVPKEIADWALYGTASAMPIFSDKMPSLYTRGDLNPRSMTLVPTSFADVPVVNAASRAVGAVAGFASAVSQGGELIPSFLAAMEHQGLSRPLAGLAQVAQGFSSTSQGSLIAANSDIASIATASRILGAKPMDESVALNHRYRLNAYRAYDMDRIESLGTVVKQKIRSGDLSEEDITDFQSRYAAAGGRAEGYSKALQRWFKTANQSDVNILMNAHRSSYGQRMLEVMGADPLPDFANPGE